ncbi:hypothetical protein F5876DRAFT_83920 [Lentinula aff. lateritia]|uniref:Uncharacterized protein n=1 Tax=Lentinula aff. lateritia TaxID=2804960 RepID=A0ACC1TH65_9AGAR|nr:hypothetical protein F5876DRAFT_83920 [Lentinula aff. lateritia]
MSTSRTTTATSTAIGSIPITGGTNNQPPALTCPTMPSPSDKEHELEMEMERDRERMRVLRERRKAEEEAKKRAEEEVARWAAEEEQQKQEAAARAVSTRRKEEEAAEKRRRIAAVAVTDRGRGSLNDQEGNRQTEYRDPDDGDGEDDDEDDEERAPCERCRMKKIPCLQQEGKRIVTRREGGSNPTGERIAVLESQMVQLLANNRQLREGQVKANTYHRHINQKLDAARRRTSPPKMPKTGPSELPKKRKRVVDSDEEEEEREREAEEQEEEKDQGEGEEEEEERELAPKKAWSEKGKERAE